MTIPTVAIVAFSSFSVEARLVPPSADYIEPGDSRVGTVRRVEQIGLSLPYTSDTAAIASDDVVDVPILETHPAREFRVWRTATRQGRVMVDAMRYIE